MKFEEKRVILAAVILLALGLFSTNMIFTGYATGRPGTEYGNKPYFTCWDHSLAKAYARNSEYQRKYDIDANGVVDYSDVDLIETMVMDRRCNFTDECARAGESICALEYGIKKVCRMNEFGVLIWEAEKCPSDTPACKQMAGRGISRAECISRTVNHDG